MSAWARHRGAGGASARLYHLPAHSLWGQGPAATRTTGSVLEHAFCTAASLPKRAHHDTRAATLPRAVSHAPRRYLTLNSIHKGQEEVDDVILRDVHRTFPEHPMFVAQAGQRALFRLLKAYSLHDLEVQYCQVRTRRQHRRWLVVPRLAPQPPSAPAAAHGAGAAGRGSGVVAGPPNRPPGSVGRQRGERLRGLHHVPQGMAFAAGVILMFLPEEPAFR